jgi:hypothetical protein
MERAQSFRDQARAGRFDLEMSKEKKLPAIVEGSFHTEFFSV